VLVRPALILLVECKRAELPHVFFKTAVGAKIDEFPRILALPRRFMPLKDAKSHARQVALADILGLGDEPFLASGPPICTSFSQAVRKGKHLVLSGANPFRRIFLPLISALVHATNYYQPGSGKHKNYWAHLTLCVAVIDGPMVVAEPDPQNPGLCLQPWVRVVRHEVSLKDPTQRRETYYGIDVVHRAFLPQFLRQHLLPFANTFGDRVERMHEVLFEGQGLVTDLAEWDWTEVRVARSGS
jgi:hypothetical protein